MKKIPPELLQKVKSAVNIIEIVGQHVVLKKAGANFSGLCPFHSERTPSFSVSENKQVYHCYGCKKGGDVINFVMDIYGISFVEAFEELAERARIALPREWTEESEAERNDPEAQKRKAAQREKISTAHRLNRFVAQFYHQQLAQNPTVQAYFRKRGVGTITDELARSFYIGAAPAGWDALANHLHAKQAPLPLAVELGLIRPSQKNATHSATGYFDLFRNRAMFPILDMRGKVAGFGGRLLPAAPGAESAPAGNEGPKYMNSPDSLIYQKSKLAFGLFQAQKHVREKNEVILVEGYFDVLALHAAGFQNAVATCGTSLTSEHIHIFRRLADRITVLFDGDRAGIQATERAMELGLEHGLILWGAAMPEGLDPDEILFDQETGAALPTGRERMEKILQEAQPLLDQRMAQAVHYAQKSPEARSQAIKHVGHWLSIYKDPVGREVRVQDFAQKLSISQNLVLQAMGHPGGTTPRSASPGPIPHPRPPQPASAKKLPPLHKSEILLLKTLLLSGQKHPEIESARGNLPPETSWPDLFENPVVRDIIEKLSIAPAQPQQILETVTDPEIRSILTEALMTEEVTSPEELRNALGRCLGRLWARFSHKIKTRLAEAEARKDAELQAILMKEYLDVQRKMKEFTSFYDEA